MQNGIIILGGHVQALGIARIFGKEKIPIVIIDKTKKNLARHSRYSIDFIHIKDEDLLIFLIEAGSKGKFLNWQIYPTNDFHVNLLSRNKIILSRFFKIAVDDWQIVENFYNKKLAYQRIAELDIPLPRTWYPANETEVQNYEDVFPCIIKPAVMYSFYSATKKKVLICKKKNELLENYKQVTKIIPSGEILIQEIIPGNS